MSLADQFLADLEDDSDDEVMNESLTPSTSIASAVKKDPEALEDADDESNIIKNDPIHYVRAYNSPKLAKILAQIGEAKERQQERAMNTEGNAATIDQSDYDLVSQANSLASEISQDITSLHHFIKERYSQRFPELESLVLSPTDYANSVKMIGNSCDVTSLNLSSILPPATVMGITISASSALTPQNVISQNTLSYIFKACDMLQSLSQNRTLLLDFVESKLLFIAPNVSAIVGSAIAAKLIIAAGGLDELARMPSTNVQLIGQKKFNLSGFSTAEYRPHTGYIYECDIVESVPPELKMKACRNVATK